MGSMKPSSLRLSLSRENLLADVKAVERPPLSPSRNLGSAWRYGGFNKFTTHIFTICRKLRIKYTVWLLLITLWWLHYCWRHPILIVNLFTRRDVCSTKAFSPKTATVAEKCDCRRSRRIRRLSPFSCRFQRHSPFSATVALFCDSRRFRWQCGKFFVIVLVIIYVCRMW